MRLLLLSGLALGCRSQPSYEVGDFEVTLTAAPRQLAGDPDAAIEIRHRDEPARLLWSSPPGEPVLTASRGVASVTYGSGSFLIEDAVDLSCAALRFRKVRQERDGALALQGLFEDCDLPLTLRFEAASASRLRLVATLGEEAGALGVNRTRVAMSSREEEAIYGLGAQYSRFNLKGELVPVWSQEQGIGRGLEPLSSLMALQEGNPAGDWWTTYTAVPFFLSDAPRGFGLEDQGYVAFDFRDPDSVSVTSWGAGLTAELIYGATPDEVSRAWTEYTGRMQALPDWSQQGAIVRAGGGSEAVRALLAELQGAGAPVAALWIEDWCGRRETSFGSRLWWSWEPDATLYPDWASLLEELRSEGVRVLLYFNPYLVDDADKPGLTRSLYAEALAEDLLVRRADGAVYTIDMGGFEAALLDLSSPEAVAWIQDLQAAQVALGADGWMADFSEALPVDAVLADGGDPWQRHNAWPRLWAELNADTAAQTGADLLTFHRSGDARSPGAAAAFWLGDQTVTWDAYDGIQTVIPALLSSGLSGYTLNHPDAGGYLSVSALGISRDAELLGRWTELAAFTALLRTHDTNQPEDNAQIGDDDASLAAFARMAQVYAALAPIRAEAMAEAEARGQPLTRPLFFDWPEEPEASRQDQSFLLGPLLVAPVLEQGATSREVWLPPGQWVHLWTGAEQASGDGGAWLTVEAPMGEPPVFYPAGDPASEALQAALSAAGLSRGG